MDPTQIKIVEDLYRVGGFGLVFVVALGWLFFWYLKNNLRIQKENVDEQKRLTAELAQLNSTIVAIMLKQHEEPKMQALAAAILEAQTHRNDRTNN